MTETGKDYKRQIIDAIEAKIDDDFDFEMPYWENSNLDDAVEYGTECGEQSAYGEIISLIKKMDL